MNFNFENLENLLNKERLEQIFHIILIIVIGFILLKIVSWIVGKLLWKSMTKQSRMLIRKGILYTGWIIIVFIVFNRLGINITTLLGAAGIVGVVVGIASQTSIGNMISGLFLVSEKPFEIGDVIRVADKTGVVYSIDLLSIKIKTFDNLLIRIPNQSIISNELTNITRFPIRRLDFNVGVAYKENLTHVKEVLLKIATNNPLCLEEPAPLIIFKDFGDSSINILFAVWFEKTNFLEVKNSIFLAIKEEFDKEGIEIPFPHRTIYTGDVTKPFPVNVVDKKE